MFLFVLFSGFHASVCTTGSPYCDHLHVPGTDQNALW